MKTGLRILSLLFTLSMASCVPQTNSGSSNGISDAYNIIDRQATSWNDCLSQSEDHYLVYFYSDTCNPCNEIKWDIVMFANSDVVKTYFVDTAKPENKIQKCSADEVVVGVSDVADLYIVGTPTLIEVKEGATVSNVAGQSKCLGLINSLKNGSGN